LAEGDTIHRAARRLGEALTGKPIREAVSPNPRAALGGSVERLRGRRLQRAEARGKHLLLHFDDGLVIHSHLGMKGAWHVYPRRARWRRPRDSAWLVLSTKSQDAAQFGGSILELLTESELCRHPRLARLGPDLLDPDFTRQRGVAALRSAPPQTQLGEALLDQGVIAGIGNVYKSEGCFAARRRGAPSPGRGDHGADAAEPRGPPPRASGLPARQAPVPCLRRAAARPRPGGRQPDHLLVRSLPDLTLRTL
jgi:endonuclease-8